MRPFGCGQLVLSYVSMFCVLMKVQFLELVYMRLAIMCWAFHKMRLEFHAWSTCFILDVWKINKMLDVHTVWLLYYFRNGPFPILELVAYFAKLLIKLLHKACEVLYWCRRIFCIFVCSLLYNYCAVCLFKLWHVPSFTLMDLYLELELQMH